MVHIAQGRTDKPKFVNILVTNVSKGRMGFRVVGLELEHTTYTTSYSLQGQGQPKFRLRRQTSLPDGEIAK